MDGFELVDFDGITNTTPLPVKESIEDDESSKNVWINLNSEWFRIEVGGGKTLFFDERKARHFIVLGDQIDPLDFNIQQAYATGNKVVTVQSKGSRNISYLLKLLPESEEEKGSRLKKEQEEEIKILKEELFRFKVFTSLLFDQMKPYYYLDLKKSMNEWLDSNGEYDSLSNFNPFHFLNLEVTRLPVHSVRRIDLDPTIDPVLLKEVSLISIFENFPFLEQITVSTDNEQLVSLLEELYQAHLKEKKINFVSV